MNRLRAALLGPLLRVGVSGACQPGAGSTAVTVLLPARLQPAQLQQAAHFRSLFRKRLPKSPAPHLHPTHPPHAHAHAHPHPKPAAGAASAAIAKKPRGLIRRALGAVGMAVGLTIVFIPLAGVGALVATGWKDAGTTELVLSVPRTAKVVWWGANATYRYKDLAARYPDRKAEPYLQELALLHEEMAQHLLLLCQSNGGVYIKAGQLAVALRAVPLEYRRTLEVLQDRVPARPFADIDKALVQELGASAEELFSRFEKGATAAASLAQVHRAWLKDGTPVAVKVQYPGLAGAVLADCASMKALARAGAALFPEVNLVWLFEELQSKVGQELDFGIEAANSARLAACMAGRPAVAVPRVLPELSTQRVLCMEWVDGCKVSDEEGLQQLGLAPKEVALALLEAFADMTFVQGFVHGDPHPGNILVRADWGSQGLLSRLALGRRPRPQLVLLDHGLYIELPEDLRHQYCQMWCAFLLNDKATAVQAASALGGERAGRILPEVLRPRDWSRVSREERRKFRAESGLNTFGDLTSILEEAPRCLLDTLRISAIVRHTAAQLGATIADRMRINATAAIRGMELRPAPAPAPTAAAAQLAVAAQQRAQVQQQEAAAAGGVVAAGEQQEQEATQQQQQGSRVVMRWRRRRTPIPEIPPPREEPAAPAGVRYYGVLQSSSRRWELSARILAMRAAFWLASLLQGLVDRVMPGTTRLA